MNLHKLSDFLQAEGQNQITLTFSQIEVIIGEKLPLDAKNKSSWWYNKKNSKRASTWMTHSYYVCEPKNIPIRCNVTFRKIQPFHGNVSVSGVRHILANYAKIYIFA